MAKILLQTTTPCAPSRLETFKDYVRNIARWLHTGKIVERVGLGSAASRRE